MKLTFLALTLFGAVALGSVPTFASDDLPRPEAGCSRIGDSHYEDVWDLCPSGRSRCRRWGGYWGFGKWRPCSQVGMPAPAPCTWSAGTNTWLCDRDKRIVCTSEQCD